MGLGRVIRYNGITTTSAPGSAAPDESVVRASRAIGCVSAPFRTVFQKISKKRPLRNGVRCATECDRTAGRVPSGLHPQFLKEAVNASRPALTDVERAARAWHRRTATPFARAAGFAKTRNRPAARNCTIVLFTGGSRRLFSATGSAPRRRFTRLRQLQQGGPDAGGRRWRRGGPRACAPRCRLGRLVGQFPMCPFFVHNTVLLPEWRSFPARCDLFPTRGTRVLPVQRRTS
jgi:hypothetical protein